MRERKEIEERIKPPYDDRDRKTELLVRVQIELLLDIRELLQMTGLGKFLCQK